GKDLLASGRKHHRYVKEALYHRVLDWLGDYPSIARRIGFGPQSFSRSSLIDDPALWERDCDWLDVDRVRQQVRDGALSPAALKLLFHWRAARDVHEGRILPQARRQSLAGSESAPA
ncbi:MAG: hypothetical protein AAGF15_10965, partial [Pseudomonadota bacterium]